MRTPKPLIKNAVDGELADLKAKVPDVPKLDDLKDQVPEIPSDLADVSQLDNLDLEVPDLPNLEASVPDSELEGVPDVPKIPKGFGKKMKF